MYVRVKTGKKWTTDGICLNSVAKSSILYFFYVFFLFLVSFRWGDWILYTHIVYTYVGHLRCDVHLYVSVNRKMNKKKQQKKTNERKSREEKPYEKVRPLMMIFFVVFRFFFSFLFLLYSLAAPCVYIEFDICVYYDERKK